MSEAFAENAGTGPPEKATETPMKVRFSEEGQATAFAHQLVGVSGVHLRADGDEWEVGIDGAKTGPFVVRVLDAVRQALAGERDAFALVSLDGHEYRLDGE
jgi:hypothetical protein